MSAEEEITTKPKIRLGGFTEEEKDDYNSFNHMQKSIYEEVFGTSQQITDELALVYRMMDHLKYSREHPTLLEAALALPPAKKARSMTPCGRGGTFPEYHQAMAAHCGGGAPMLAGKY